MSGTPDFDSFMNEKADVQDSEALFQRGLRYCRGDGVLKDYAEAIRWLRPAAEQGHIEAQYFIGVANYNVSKRSPEDQAELFQCILAR